MLKLFHESYFKKKSAGHEIREDIFDKLSNDSILCPQSDTLNERFFFLCSDFPLLINLLLILKHNEKLLLK